MTDRYLYAVLLGGKIRTKNLMEDHQLVFVVAGDEADARKLAKRKWNAEDVHVDGTERLSTVDGYAVRLERSGEPENDVSEIDDRYTA